MAEGKPSEGRLYTCSPAELARTLAVAESGVATRTPVSPLGATLGPEGTLAEPALRAIPAARYELVREIGRGGMGRVDEMLDRALGRTVAWKSCAEDDEALAAILVAEAQICAQLEHPSIVPVYDIGFDDDGRPHYTMRVVRGRTLRDALESRMEGRRGAPSLAQLVGILRLVCLAVDYAHSRGVVHRDLKPENVVVGDFGEVYVLDWGIAHVLEGSDVRHDAALVVRLSSAGSPGYMAPEQAIGDAIEPRTDVFALGVMLYEILAGAQPYSDRDLSSVLERARVDIEVAAPSVRNPHTAPPGVFDPLVMACLSRDPRERPAGARVIADAIDAFLDAERARGEREREALGYVAEGEAARADAERLHQEAQEASARGAAMLASLRPWEPAEHKRPGWELAQRGRALSAEAARAMARAEAAFTRAIGRVADQPDARRGLASLYWRQFLSAEECLVTPIARRSTSTGRVLATTVTSSSSSPIRGRSSSRPDAPPGAVVVLARYEHAKNPCSSRGPRGPSERRPRGRWGCPPGRGGSASARERAPCGIRSSCDARSTTVSR